MHHCCHNRNFCLFERDLGNNTFSSSCSATGSTSSKALKSSNLNGVAAAAAPSIIAGSSMTHNVPAGFAASLNNTVESQERCSAEAWEVQIQLIEEMRMVMGTEMGLVMGLVMGAGVGMGMEMGLVMVPEMMNSANLIPPKTHMR